MNSPHVRLEAALNSTYTCHDNEVSDKYDEIAWDMGFDRNTFRDYANDEGNRYDLRGMAAMVYTMSLYPKVPWPDSPQTQTPNILSDARTMLLKKFAAISERPVLLGILEALERVSDFDRTRLLFESHEDLIVREQAKQFLAEQG